MKWLSGRRFRDGYESDSRLFQEEYVELVKSLERTR
jgi:hypothetical protein